MKRLTGILSVAFAAMLLNAGVAMAQSQTPPTGGAAGTGNTKDMDLPFEKPAGEKLSGEFVPPEPPPEPEPPEEPPIFNGEPIPSENSTIFYVIDASGSMASGTRSYVDDQGNSRSGTRMDRAKSELRKSVNSLPRTFKFNMLAYGCSVQRFRGVMIEANASNKATAIGWINGLYASGGTMTGPATAQGLSDRENKSVVLLTDGAPNCGASSDAGHRSVITGANTQRAIVTVFGIGATGSFRRFCQDVARDNGGNYVDVP